MIIEIVSLIALSVLMTVALSAVVIAVIVALVKFAELVYERVSGWFKLVKIWHRERNGKIRSAVIVIQGKDEEKLSYRLEQDSKVYSEKELPEFKEMLDQAENRDSYIEVDGVKMPAVVLDKEAEERAKNQNNDYNH